MDTATVPQLLAEDEPPAVVVENAGGRSPFFLTCDHAGRRLPRRLGMLGLPDVRAGAAHRLGYRGGGRGAPHGGGARRHPGHAALFAAGDRLQPGAGCRDLDRPAQRAHAGPGEREPDRGRGGGPGGGNFPALPRSDHGRARPARAERAAHVPGLDPQLHAGIQGRVAADAGGGALQPRPALRPAHARAAAGRGRPRGRRQRPLRRKRRDRLHDPGPWRAARPAACRAGDPAGPDRGRGRPARLGRPPGPVAARGPRALHDARRS